MKELKEIKSSQKTKKTGRYLKKIGTISGIICILAGLIILPKHSQNTLTWKVPTIIDNIYNSMGIFFIVFGLFIIGLLWRIAYIIDRK
jgi:hypothetical protein